MTDDLHRIRSFVRRLVRWERGLILGRIVLQAAMLVAVLLVLAVAAAGLRWDRSAATAALVLIGGVGAWGLVAVPLLLRWRWSGDARRQARLVEGLVPDLRGRLLTAVERVDGQHGGESAAMVGLVARRAAGMVADLRPSRVHPVRPLLALGAATSFVYVASLVVMLLSPAGLTGTFKWWMRGGAGPTTADGLMVEQQDALARVGDIVLQYTYPDYTGLDPLEISNSTGDVQGPPGTRVRVIARSADPVEAAALVAYDQPALDAEVSEGRVLSGTFTIQAEEGGYELVTYSRGEPNTSRTFSITPEPDLPPEVMLDAPDEVVEVAANERLPFLWSARDDYGVARVVVEVDGQERGTPLKRPRERRAELNGALDQRPVDLGLSPGSDVKLRIAAWDNDTYSGSKPGYSRAIRLVVLGKRGQDLREEQRQQELIGLLLDVLADSLEEPWPPGRTAHEVSSWGQTVSERYAAIDAFVEANRRALFASRIEAPVIAKVTRTSRELIRYTQVAFSPGDRSAPSAEASEVLSGLRDDAIEALEDGILAVDRAVRLRAFRRVVEDSEALADKADELERMLSQEDVDPQEMLARLGQLEHMLAELAQNAAKLEEGGLKEYLNQRNDEMRNVLEEIRQALAEGRTEEARELMSRLAQQMRDMRDGLQEQLERQKQEGDETMQQAQDLQKELSEIEEAQKSLQERTRELREREDAQGAEQAEKLWEQIDEIAARLARNGDEYADGVEKARRSFNEQQRARDGADQGRRLKQSVTARDLRGADRAVRDARSAWHRAGAALAWQRGRGSVPGPGNRELEALQRDLDRIEDLLRKLQETGASPSPQLQQEAQQLEQEQQQLQERLQKAQQEAQQLVREFPVRPDGLEESLQEADQQMGQAEQDLGQGQPMPAEGSQGVAAQRVKDARESLEQAMQQAQQQQQQLEQGGEPQDGQPDQGGSQGQEQRRAEKVEIPNPEEFQTPEEYRRALLEGMEGEVPEEYRALKKRYYEELVQQ